MKNKLIELLNDSFAKQYEKRGLLTAYHTAEDLIANGVTIQRWIPVEERLPEENGRYLVHSYIPSLKHPFIYAADFSNDLYKVDSYDFARMKGKGGFFSYDNEWGFFEIDSITHWMPLPKGPKEE